MAKKKNPAAVAMAKLRAKSLTKTERQAIAKKAALARSAKLSAEQRAEIARKAGKAGAAARWGNKNK
jgi:hypothetical protein